MPAAYEKNSAWAHLLPPFHLECCEENLKQFFQIMFERQEIWYKRTILKQPFPWTEDCYLQNYKFTNVYRELDKSSQFLINNVIKVETSWEEMLFKIIVYRLFNNPETFKEIPIPNFRDYDEEKFREDIASFRDSGKNPFTSSYLVNSSNSKKENFNGKPKRANPSFRDDFYCYRVVPMVWKLIPSFIEKLNVITENKNLEAGAEEVFKMFFDIHSVSDFISHEFYIDLTYVTKYNPVLSFPFTENHFTNVGPGASLGLRLIYPRLAATTSRSNMKKGIYDLRHISGYELAQIGVFKYLGYDIKTDSYFHDKKANLEKANLSLHQMEMWLCEYQKYWKMQVKLGKQRSKYVYKIDS